MVQYQKKGVSSFLVVRIGKLIVAVVVCCLIFNRCVLLLLLLLLLSMMMLLYVAFELQIFVSCESRN